MGTNKVSDIRIKVMSLKCTKFSWELLNEVAPGFGDSFSHNIISINYHANYLYTTVISCEIEVNFNIYLYINKSKK